MALKFITAEEAASYVHHNDNVGFSGFTPAGCPKVVPGAIARKAAEEHAKGNPFQIGMFTGASTGDKLDGELARANAIKFRTPYQSNKDLRAALNAHQAQYFDLHLSELAQSLRYGFLGKIDVAIVEAADVTEDGEIVPTSGVGILPTICRMADRIIVELNCRHPKEIRGMHDIYEPADPPLRREIPIYTPSDRIGNDCVKVDPAKIVGVVRTDEPNEGGKFSPLDDVTMAIGKNVADFLVSEIKGPYGNRRPGRTGACPPTPHEGRWRQPGCMKYGGAWFGGYLRRSSSRERPVSLPSRLIRRVMMKTRAARMGIPMIRKPHQVMLPMAAL